MNTSDRVLEGRDRLGADLPQVGRRGIRVLLFEPVVDQVGVAELVFEAGALVVLFVRP